MAKFWVLRLLNSQTSSTQNRIETPRNMSLAFTMVAKVAYLIKKNKHHQIKNSFTSVHFSRTVEMPSRPSFHFIEHQSDATTPTPIFAETLTATVSGSKLCKNKISSFLLPAENPIIRKVFDQGCLFFSTRLPLASTRWV